MPFESIVMITIAFFAFFFRPAQCAFSLNPRGRLQFIFALRFLLHLRFCGGLDIWLASDPREIAIIDPFL